MKKLSFITALILAGSSTAYAQNPGDTYFGVEYGLVNLNASDLDSWDTGVLFGRYGMVIQKGLAAEGFIGIGLQDDKWTSTNGCDSQVVSTDYIFGAQLKTFTDIDKVSLHASIGLNMVAASIETSGKGGSSCYGTGWSESYSDTEMALTYGVGADFNIDHKSAVSVNYQLFYNDNYDGVDLQISGLLIGYKQNF